MLAEEQAITGKVSNVIVYRGQALVTRDIEVTSKASSFEIVVTGLPEQIIPDSLYTDTPAGLTVSSVRYRKQTIKEDTREEVKAIEQQIEELKEKLHKATRDRQNWDQMWNRHNDMWKLSLDSTKTDFNSKGTFDFNALQGLMAYLEQKEVEIHNTSVELELEKGQLEKQISQLEVKIKELAETRVSTIHEAVLLVNKIDANPAVIKLNYLVDNANWSPQYNLHAKVDKSQCDIEYNALIHQSTGEDWTGVSLCLSTAQPSTVSGAPTIEPLEITLIPLVSYNVDRSKVAGQIEMEETPQSAMLSKDSFSYVDQTQNFHSLLNERSAQAQKGKQAQVALNRLAVQNQAMEIVADADSFKRIKSETKKIHRNEGIAVTYKVEGAITLPSKSDQQFVNIASVTVGANYTMLATPLLTDYVYLQASMTNTSNTIFLPGGASMFRDGQFIGKGDMNLVTINQTFEAGFGIDSQIKVVREFEDKKIETLWGNRVDKNSYRIAIHSFKNEPVKLRLFDRIPYTENKELAIIDFKTNTELSKDEEYLRTEHKKGLLRWDLDLKPNTSDSNSTVITYEYTLKYDDEVQIQPIASK